MRLVKRPPSARVRARSPLDNTRENRRTPRLSCEIPPISRTAAGGVREAPPAEECIIARYADVTLTAWGPRRPVEPLGYADAIALDRSSSAVKRCSSAR
jgi:hypothetical protein